MEPGAGRFRQTSEPLRSGAFGEPQPPHDADESDERQAEHERDDGPVPPGEGRECHGADRAALESWSRHGSREDGEREPRGSDGERDVGVSVSSGLCGPVEDQDGRGREKRNVAEPRVRCEERGRRDPKHRGPPPQGRADSIESELIGHEPSVRQERDGVVGDAMGRLREAWRHGLRHPGRIERSSGVARCRAALSSTRRR